MRQLWRKELRQQAPFAALGLGLVAVDAYEHLDAATPTSLAFTLDSLSGSAFSLVLLLAFALGQSVLTREDEDGTLAFLDGLPTTRGRVFFSKVSIAMVVASTYGVSFTGLMLWWHAAGFTSLSRWHPQLIATALALHLLEVFVALSLGLALGYLRRLAWAALAGLVVLQTTLSVSQGWADRFDPDAVCQPHYQGVHWLLPWSTLALHSSAAVGCCALAFVLFSGRVTWRFERLSAFASRPVFSALALALTVGGGIAAMRGLARESRSESSTASESRGVTTTTHYRFAYPGARARAAVALAAHADEIFEAVVGKLHAPLPQEVIDVDGSGAVANTSGTAFTTKVRLDLDQAHPEATLAHETTHILARRMSGGEQGGPLDDMIGFNEGLATYIQWKVRPLSDGSSHAKHLAALEVRHATALRELMDYHAFARRYDAGEKYTLGLLLVSSLVDRYGEDAPARVLSVIGEKTFPKGLSDYALWEAAFQLAGFDLSAVMADSEREAKAALARYRTDVDRLPRLRAQLLDAEGHKALRITGDRPIPPGAKVVARVRSTDDAPLDTYKTWLAAKNGVVWLDDDLLVRNEACFQPGIEWEAGTVFEPWTCLGFEVADPVSVESLEEPDAGSDAGPSGVEARDAGSEGDAGTGESGEAWADGGR